MKIKKIVSLIPCFYLPFLILLINIPFVYFRIYPMFPGLDFVMHLLGGGTLAYSFFLVLKRLNKEIIINDFFIKIVFVVSLISLCAVFWEFLEGIIYLTLTNTVWDLFFGVVGGLIIAIILELKEKERLI